jgi:glycine oxidase
MSASPSRGSAGLHVAVVGAGLIGLGIAWRLAQRGCRVSLYERCEPGSGASFAAAGMLSVIAEAEPVDPRFFALCQESRARWAAFADELERLTGHRIGFRAQGTLLVARSAADETRLANLAAERGDDSLLRRLERSEWRRLEPALADALHGVYLAPQDSQADNRATAAALVRAFAIAGGVLVQADVLRIAVIDGRVVGVDCADKRHDADIVVVATGVGTDALMAASHLGALVPPIVPVKGEMIALRMDTDAPIINQVVRSEAFYLVPRLSGRLIVGATSEPGRSDSTLTAAARRALRSGAAAIAPSLAGAPVVDHWSGVRPMLPGGLPLIGNAGPEGLMVALGHYRNGVLLTPVTADLVTALVMGAGSASELALAAPFDPAVRASPGSN